MSEMPVGDDYESDYMAPPYEVVSQFEHDGHIVTLALVDGELMEFALSTKTVAENAVYEAEKVLAKEA